MIERVPFPWLALAFKKRRAVLRRNHCSHSTNCILSNNNEYDGAGAIEERVLVY